MGDTNASQHAPERGEIESALAEATRIKQDTLSFMQAAEKADNVFIRRNEGKPEGYAETPYGAALVGARESVDRLTIVILSLTRLQRSHATMFAADFRELLREIERARVTLAGLGTPPDSEDEEDEED
ncbi:hypothetical protein [Magnetospirillum fulvum]|uniref:Uncharacterized protein n=1 Tax=Magnetospirillum fulvum TaxID=1082 RepID=A0A1H6JBK8_MAGFU|nr:hypothetical protein [Magnetospirillum fulvum]SEH57014.1 hypothetical protein SAMN04244559_03006 [Magnetospirillum fulvum]